MEGDGKQCRREDQTPQQPATGMHPIHKAKAKKEHFMKEQTETITSEKEV